MGAEALQIPCWAKARKAILSSLCVCKSCQCKSQTVTTHTRLPARGCFSLFIPQLKPVQSCQNAKSSDDLKFATLTGAEQFTKSLLWGNTKASQTFLSSPCLQQSWQECSVQSLHSAIDNVVAHPSALATDLKVETSAV